jgi:hypothetical protein
MGSCSPRQRRRAVSTLGRHPNVRSLPARKPSEAYSEDSLLIVIGQAPFISLVPLTLPSLRERQADPSLLQIHCYLPDHLNALC